LSFLGFNLVFGLTLPGIDTAAHIGGLVGGFLAGVVLSQPLTHGVRAGRLIRNVAVGGLGALLVAGGMLGANTKYGDVVRVQIEVDQFAEMERKALTVFNAAAVKAQKQELTDAAFADLLEREVLPEWRAARERLSTPKNIPAPLLTHISSMLEYMRLREEAWELAVQAMREGNMPLAQRSLEKQQLANAAAKRIVDSAGNK